jgi:formylmethanofuran dehydrogenase subunit E
MITGATKMMTAQEILNSEDFKRCEAFHGHVCPGLSIGYRAAKSGMARLAEKWAKDEEVVAVVETDACSADAVQVLTGCTFGKGNFIFKDHGKMALTLFSRKTGQGVRLIVRAGAFAPNEEHLSLIQKMTRGEATEAEQKRFRELHLQKAIAVLEMPEHDLFAIKDVQTELPAKAMIEPSIVCARCGEAAMRSKMKKTDSGDICRNCTGD